VSVYFILQIYAHAHSLLTHTLTHIHWLRVKTHKWRVDFGIKKRETSTLQMCLGFRFQTNPREFPYDFNCNWQWTQQKRQFNKQLETLTKVL